MNNITYYTTNGHINGFEDGATDVPSGAVKVSELELIKMEQVISDEVADRELKVTELRTAVAKRIGLSLVELEGIL